MALTPALQKFTTASPVIASYDWKDMINSTGYLELDGIILVWGATYGTTATGILVNFNRKSSTDWKRFGHSDASEELIAAEFVSTKFNITRILEGTAYMSFTWGLQNYSPSSSANQERKIRIDLYKNTTLIASTAETTSIKIASAGQGASNPKIELLPFTIPKTILNSEDSLTIKVVSIQVNQEDDSQTFTTIIANVLDEEVIVHAGEAYEITFPAGTTRFVTWLPVKIEV